MGVLIMVSGAVTGLLTFLVIRLFINQQKIFKDLKTLADYSGQNRAECRTGLRGMNDLCRSLGIVADGHRKELNKVNEAVLDMEARLTASGIETPAGAQSGPRLEVITRQFADALVRTMKVVTKIELSRKLPATVTDEGLKRFLQENAAQISESLGGKAYDDGRPEDDLEADDPDQPGSDDLDHELPQ